MIEAMKRMDLELLQTRLTDQWWHGLTRSFNPLAPHENDDIEERLERLLRRIRQGCRQRFLIINLRFWKRLHTGVKVKGSKEYVKSLRCPIWYRYNIETRLAVRVVMYMAPRH